jgi:hypothetical protein
MSAVFLENKYDIFMGNTKSHAVIAAEMTKNAANAQQLLPARSLVNEYLPASHEINNE